MQVTVTNAATSVAYSTSPSTVPAEQLFAELLVMARAELDRANGARPFVLDIGGASGTITKGNGRSADDLGASLLALFAKYGWTGTLA